MSLGFPDLLSGARLLLSPVAATSLLFSLRDSCPWQVPLGALLLGAASDLADGIFARRIGRVGVRGQRLDALADIALLLPTIAILAYAGILPLLLPPAVTFAFSLYAASLFALPQKATGKRHVADRLGHLGGIGNWLVACAGVAAAAPSAPPLLVSLTYVLGVLDTLINSSAALLRLRFLAGKRPPREKDTSAQPPQRRPGGRA